MATFVLVPGAWLGGWCWRRLTPALRAAGHDVYPVTLTGLGERHHLGRPDTDLDTHIADVTNLVEFEELRDVVLVGHSYAGAVVTGVADRLPERLAQLVFLDSGPFEDGEAQLDFSPPEEGEELRRQVAESGDGWRLPPPPFAQLPQTPSLAGLDSDDRALLAAKAVAQPFRTWTQPLHLTDTAAGGYKRVIIACNDFRDLLATGAPRFQALAAPEWRRYDLATGHWSMLSAPRELADLLLDMV